MPTYPPALYDAPVPLPKLDTWHWRRRFRCPNADCEHTRRQAGAHGRRVIGWQQIRKNVHDHGAPMRPDGTVAPGTPIRPPDVGFLMETVWLARELTDKVPALPDGTLAFGLPEGARDDPNAASRARALSVLESAEFLSPLGLVVRGDAYQTGRHVPARRRGGTGYWVIALGTLNAWRPFVVTCPDCQQRCFVDGVVPENELRALDEHSA